MEPSTMESFSTVRTFTSGDILALANSYYAQGSLSQWGPDGLFNEMLGLVPGASPVIVPIAWDINGLLGHLVFVVDPGMPGAWILRIVLASEFLWLGLRPVGTTDVPLGMYHHSLVDIIRQRPLAAAVMFPSPLGVNGEWLGILSTLQGHLGCAKGAIQGAGSLPVLGCSDSMDISPMSSPTVSPDTQPMDITPLPSPMEWMAEEDL